MKSLTLLLLSFALLSSTLHAQTPTPDTVKVGTYVTSIHNIDFKQKEYAISLWLWLKYKRKDFNFLQIE